MFARNTIHVFPVELVIQKIFWPYKPHSTQARHFINAHSNNKYIKMNVYDTDYSPFTESSKKIIPDLVYCFIKAWCWHWKNANGTQLKHKPIHAVSFTWRSCVTSTAFWWKTTNQIRIPFQHPHADHSFYNVQSG